MSNLAAMKVFRYDVASSPISVHLPVSRFLAGKNIRGVRRAVFKFILKIIRKYIGYPSLRSLISLGNLHNTHNQ